MLELARVIESHPESAAVDLFMLRDNRHLAGVPVLSGWAGNDFGATCLGEPQNGDRVIFAVVGWMNGDHPVVVGFLYPQVAQVLFEDKERAVWRHPSDVYVSIDADGNTELFHPSGAWFRIGEMPEHEDLTGKDYDKVWKISRNTDRKVHIHCEIPGQSRWDMSPDGRIDVWAKGEIKVRSEEHIALSAPRIDLN